MHIDRGFCIEGQLTESTDRLNRSKPLHTRVWLSSNTCAPLIPPAYGSLCVSAAVSRAIRSSADTAHSARRYGWSANMQKIMQAQALGDSQRQAYMMGKRTLEINPRHPLVVELLAKVEADPEDSAARDTASLLYETALLESGFPMQDDKAFATRVRTPSTCNVFALLLSVRDSLVLAVSGYSGSVATCFVHRGSIAESERKKAIRAHIRIDIGHAPESSILMLQSPLDVCAYERPFVLPGC